MRAPVQKLVNKQSLKERGWTESLIKKHLGDPDVRKTNPRYKSAAPTCLYDDARVARIEATVEFHLDLERASRRRESAGKGVDRRREQTQALLDALRIEVPLLEWDELVTHARRSYDNLQFVRGGEFKTSSGFDERFLHRICVNFLRHECTEYEVDLLKLSGHVGADEARFGVKCKVLDAIAERYPTLADECYRQAYNSRRND